MSHDDNSSGMNQSQVAAKNLTAGRDIQIGRIVQTIVNLGLPFNSQHLRFVQFLANSAYLTCLIWGFIRLWQNGADSTTLLLLLLGSGLLSLTCLYYAWFWKPELQDKNAPGSESSDSDERIKQQQTKQRSRQRTRQLAVVGIFAIPLLTCAGFFLWRSLPPQHVLLLVANFDGVEQQKYRVTENVLRELRSATESYTDVEVQALNQVITEQQGSKIARAIAEQKKATIMIWGDYGVTADHVQIGTHFEVLKPPDYFPELGATANGEARTLAVAQLNSFKLQESLSNEMTYLTLFTLGIVQFAEENWENAITHFSNALTEVEEPISVLGQDAIYFYRGNSHIFRSDYKKAIADYTQAIELTPDYTDALSNRGVAYYFQGNYNQAIADYNQVLRLKPDNATAYSHRGVAYADQGNYNQAINDFNQALRFKPNYAEAYNNRGSTYGDQGNYNQAINDFNQALRFKPNYAGAYYNRGIAYNRQGNYNQAINDFNQALRFKPDYAETYNDRGNAYNSRGNYSQAIADYTQALKLKPDFAEAYYNRGIAYYNRGNYSQAIADYTQALELKPDFALAYYNRGAIYYSQDNYDRAINDFNQALKFKPNFALAYYTKACAYSLKRESQLALENLQRAISLDEAYREKAKTDSSFDNIRQDEQFQALVGQ